MRIFRNCILFVLMSTSIDSFCQATEKVEMADVLRQDGKIYTVVLGLVVILTAMIVLLIRIERRIFKLEKEMKK
jgi:hypothetical protein